MTIATVDEEIREEFAGVADQFLRSRLSITDVRQRVLDPATGHGHPEMAQMGWLGIGLDEADGGVGFGLHERNLIAEAMGHHLVPHHFLTNGVLAVDVLSRAGCTDAGRRLLHEVVAGERLATLVAAGSLHAGVDPGGSVRATASADGYRLHGDAGLVFGAERGVTLAVVAETDEGLALFALDVVDGLAAAEAIVDETRRVHRVVFDGHVAERIDGSGVPPQVVDAALDCSTITISAEMIGSAAACLQFTTDYVKDRHQFGVPIGSFQAIKHRLADCLVQVEAARESIYFAADTVDAGATGNEVGTMAAMAKIAANDAFSFLAATAIQLHGGIGFTSEHNAQLFYKRALLSSALLGSTISRRGALAKLVRL